MGIGVVVRDDQGHVAAAISKRINEPFGVMEVEAKAFEEGLLFAKDIGIQDFILEGDSSSSTRHYLVCLQLLLLWIH